MMIQMAPRDGLISNALLEQQKYQQLSQLKLDAERLSEDFLAAGDAPGLNPVTRSLLKSFRLCGACNEFLRLGEPNDGGYLTCMDGAEDVVGALSLGVEHHDQWTEDVHNLLAVKIGQFDCTVNTGTECGGDCKFFKECIGSSDGHEQSDLQPVVTLKKALENMGFDNAAEGTVLLKMDIEGSEWPIFEVEPRGVLDKFKQIILEVHWLDRTEQHDQMLKAMSTLRQAGFYAAHLHGNNYGGMYNVGNYQIPNVLEVTFVRTDGGQCKSWQSRPEDAANDKNNTEIGHANLPSL